MLKQVLIAVAIAFATTGIAAAQAPAEQKGDAAKGTTTEQKKDAQTRHDHARDHKQGAPSAKVDPKAKKKKPLHDHGKTHKQQ